VTWGISPQQVTSIDGRVPDPADAADSEARTLGERALDYMRLTPGTPLAACPSTSRTSARARTRGSPTCAPPRRC
jgi:hypothetical protein